MLGDGYMSTFSRRIPAPVLGGFARGWPGKTEKWERGNRVFFELTKTGRMSILIRRNSGEEMFTSMDDPGSRRAAKKMGSTGHGGPGAPVNPQRVLIR